MGTVHTDDIESIAIYGLDKIREDETVTVNLRDLMYVHQSLFELIRFFHQPAHYDSLADIKEFLGSRGDKKGYDLIHNSYYKKLRPLIESAVEDLWESGTFNTMLDRENTVVPYYYKPKNET